MSLQYFVRFCYFWYMKSHPGSSSVAWSLTPFQFPIRLFCRWRYFYLHTKSKQILSSGLFIPFSPCLSSKLQHSNPSKKPTSMTNSKIRTGISLLGSWIISHCWCSYWHIFKGITNAGLPHPLRHQNHFWSSRQENLTTTEKRNILNLNQHQ